MKKLFFNVCAASLLLFSACSKDDKDVSEMSSTEISSMIVGTWQLTQVEWSYKEESGVDKYYEGEAAWIFNKDNTWIITQDIDEDEEKSTTARWNIENNTFIGYNDDERGEFVIEKLTKNELILSREEYYPDADFYYFDRYYFKR